MTMIMGIFAIALINMVVHWHRSSEGSHVRGSDRYASQVSEGGSTRNYGNQVASLRFDCAKHDPEVSEDTEKNFAELLTEELKLREVEALENEQRADMALLEAKKITSQYQKEADKCNSGMETCEEAREKAEAALVAQKKLTATWELRARQRGWKEGIAKSHAQTQGNVQTA
uniref:DUF1068 domain-containing protein n=1 Tax=Fagus sylvatica TaxID=28930 RepID=A0A2N9J4H1_FAGSY